MRRALAIAVAIMACVSIGCDATPTATPTAAGSTGPSPTSFVQVRPTRDVGQSARDLLGTLPTTAGGVTLDGSEVIDDSINVGFEIDYVLQALGKRRPDAVFVSRFTEDVSISATHVIGVDGETLFKTVVETWVAPAVIRRSTRPVAIGLTGWELQERLGNIDVIYRVGDVVYIVTSPNRELLEAVLHDMPMRVQ